VLERAGLISRRRDAQRRPCRLEARALRDATEWLDGYRRFWSESFGRLDDLLDELQTPTGTATTDTTDTTDTTNTNTDTTNTDTTDTTGAPR